MNDSSRAGLSKIMKTGIAILLFFVPMVFTFDGLSVAGSMLFVLIAPLIWRMSDLLPESSLDQ